MALVLVLMAAMVYEVVCRFGLNSPNIWALDVAYMLAGTLFYLGAAYTLKADAHVKIDFLSQRFPPRVAFAIHVVFIAGVFLPIVGMILFSVLEKSWKAYSTGQTDYTSPWNPVMWPFYTTIGVGLFSLWLQALASVVERILLRLRRNGAIEHPAP